MKMGIRNKMIKVSQIMAENVKGKHLRQSHMCKGLEQRVRLQSRLASLNDLNEYTEWLWKQSGKVIFCLELGKGPRVPRNVSSEASKLRLAASNMGKGFISPSHAGMPVYKGGSDDEGRDGR